MKPSHTRNLLLAALMLAASSAVSHAAVIFQPSGVGTGNFGQPAGITVNASTTGPSWTPLLADGGIYTVSDITFTKNRAAASTVGDLWVGVYFSDGILANRQDLANTTYLGSSTNFINYNNAANQAALTWTFEGLSFTASPTSHLHFVFQDGAGELSAVPARPNNDNDLLRFNNDASNTLDNLGAGIIPGGNNGPTSSNRVPVMTLTVIPEPATAMMSALGMLASLRRRRR